MVKRVLVVYKKDAYQQYLQEQQDPHLLRLLRRRHPDMLEMQRAHHVHEESLEAVVHTLRRSGTAFDLAFRSDVRMTRPYHLIVSVGGDGTFLQAARSAGRTPVLGVNSDPDRSEAVFCAARRRTFEPLCQAALAGRLPALRLYRLTLSLNGRRLAVRALNDVLVVHEDPATMSRYRLHIGRREELQKSSGLWVATAAGSSSAVLAAGGVRLPTRSPRRSRPHCGCRGRPRSFSTARARCTGDGYPAAG